jgi:hypothetical protein
MGRICVDDTGKPFQLDPAADFLAHEADKKLGRGDYQGCSEFNPSRVFSKAEDAGFKKSADHTERDKANQPNRRVLIYLFPPGRSVDLSKWPCPAAKQGVAVCKEQFFKSDPKGDVRRNPQELHREYKSTLDTFACKFYDRFAVESPCERGGLKVQTQLVRVHLRLVYLDPEGNPLPFPEKMPVIVEFVPGNVRDATLELAADGRLTFNADRRKVSFRLVFPAGATTYVSHAMPATKTFTGERLLTTDSDRDQAMADACHGLDVARLRCGTDRDRPEAALAVPALRVFRPHPETAALRAAVAARRPSRCGARQRPGGRGQQLDRGKAEPVSVPALDRADAAQARQGGAARIRDADRHLHRDRR